MNDTLVQQVAATLKAGGPGPSSRVTVGLSGGIDSVVLLHVLRRGLRWSPQRISAIHINHQISQHAASWATHCRRYCRTLGVNLKVVKVEVPRGNSTEAAARAARLGVFVDCNADVVALAHNRDDQAETLMLQLLRGAGPRGLAASVLIHVHGIMTSTCWTLRSDGRLHGAAFVCSVCRLFTGEVSRIVFSATACVILSASCRFWVLGL